MDKSLVKMMIKILLLFNGSFLNSKSIGLSSDKHCSPVLDQRLPIALAA
jgi:hypothetical protein